MSAAAASSTHTTPVTPIPASTSTFQLSPSKRARSPDIAVSSLSSLGQPVAKSASSPSTRERSQRFSSKTAGESNGSSTATQTMSSRLQQQTSSSSNGSLANGNGQLVDGNHAASGSNLQSSGGLARSPNSSSKTKTHQRAATTGNARVFSNTSNSSTASMTSFAKPADPSYNSTNSVGSSSTGPTQQQLQQTFRAPTHSGSTTSGFSGSTGSSYDSVISLDGNSLPPGTAGLGMIVQGPAYASPSPAQPLAYSTSCVYQQVPSSQPQAGYYAQPYGYQPVASSSTSSATLQHGAFAPAQLQNYTSPTSSQIASYHDPALNMQTNSLRRSIAQSVGGSSYQSGASNSPVPGMHRRSEDMDSTFLSPVLPDSAQAQYTPLTDINSSPAMSGQSQQHKGQVSYSNVPVQASHQMQHQQGAANMVYTASDTSSVAQPYYAPSAQDYQSVVDQIMSQSRKGTDYGMDLGDFEMLDTLGTGTFGRVLLVRLVPKAGQSSPLPAGMPHYFAMKVLTKTEVVRLKQVEHINCERSILGAVDHPGIVNLFCTFQDSLNIYMLLEFVQGGELFSHLRRAVRFSADVSRFYAANIISVLEYLHSRNLIYRDLKPENLLLDHQGYLKVTDFGFAKYVPDRTFTLCGTPEYLAPEIINSAGHGKAADWWAFGVLLFEMLCGYPPFFDESPWGIYEKILAGNFSFPPHVDPVARDLIRRLLSSDRSKRLGNLRNGAQDVKSHQWFEGVDWTAVERRIIPAPIIPRIKSTSDSQNFERYPSIPIESLPGLAKAKGYQVKEAIDPYEHMFTNF